ncbi:hypothetical protein GE21DRAFT_1310846 [Neurospora crassa]|nr:hypothetical protein GE21DRAFT_1310846 [Neurospora crassa]
MCFSVHNPSCQKANSFLLTWDTWTISCSHYSRLSLTSEHVKVLDSALDFFSSRSVPLFHLRFSSLHNSQVYSTPPSQLLPSPIAGSITRTRTTHALRQQLLQMNSMAEPLAKHQRPLDRYRFQFPMQHQQQQQQREQQQLERQQLEQQQLQPNIYTSSVSKTRSCGASASTNDFWKSSRLIFS